MNSIVQTASHIAVPAPRRAVWHLWVLALVVAAIAAGALLTAAHPVAVDPQTVAFVGP